MSIITVEVPPPIPRRNASGENSVIQSVSHGQQRIHFSKVAKFSTLANCKSKAKTSNKWGKAGGKVCVLCLYAVAVERS